ncbi:hypothetical protein IE53DRAFT_385489 [Violaceomyces palustris]|uniref:Uncharacterized protein n=1 Tax=Violaceomyces palustris TaxID=1673888 RepID=A0ACD0P1T7_9BASI|nr:hypothetical protein IE53DRAFT_385489 [Violaceomyces palustris]
MIPTPTCSPPPPPPPTPDFLYPTLRIFLFTSKDTSCAILTLLIFQTKIACALAFHGSRPT